MSRHYRRYAKGEEAAEKKALRLKRLDKVGSLGRRGRIGDDGLLYRYNKSTDIVLIVPFNFMTALEGEKYLLKVTLKFFTQNR